MAQSVIRDRVRLPPDGPFQRLPGCCHGGPAKGTALESLIETLSHPLPGFEGQLPITFFFMLPIFWAAVIILNNLMLKPVMSTVDRRKAASSGTSEGAAQLQSDAQKLVADYAARVRSTTDEAAAAREKVISQTRAECESKLAAARQSAEASVTTARDTIRKETETARGELRAEVDRIADEMARKLLGRAA